MANVQNFDSAGLYGVENLVAIARNDLDANRRIGGSPGAQWVMTKVLDGRVDRPADIVGAGWAVLL